MYTVAAIARAMYIALGSSRFGCIRSFAVKVMTPNPRKAKKVSATLETIWRMLGYPENASSDQFTSASMTIEKKTRMPITTRTMSPCAFATAPEPMTFSVPIASTISTANTLAQVAFPSVNIELA